ncbi:hypothetical protein Tco_0147578, partial [Tanacetum coccineum]
LLEQVPRSPEYVPDPIKLEDYVPVYIPEPEHPEDLVPAEDEAPTPLLPPSFLAPRIRPPHTRAAMRQMRATSPSTYHSLLPSGTPPLLPIPLPSTSCRADIPEADTPSQKRLLLTTPRPECEVGESSAAATARQPGPTIETRLLDTERRMMTTLELVNRRITYQVELWNLKVQGIDVVAYNQQFQELALLSDRMFPEETDKIKRYVGGMPDSIYSSVVASKPTTMQEAIEMATELMDRRNNTLAERQTENKRKFEDPPRNNQNQQPNKRQNTGMAYAAGNGD